MRLIILLAIFFFLSISVVGFFHIENVSGDNVESTKSIDPEIKTFIIQPEEKLSPYDRIDSNDVHIYQQRVTIDIKNAYISKFTDTNSMDPVIDIGANAIQIMPESNEDIHVGDIISFDTPFASNRIIHRVIAINEDDEGWYATTKGDNLNYADPHKVRFDDIKRVVVGILY